MNYKVIKITISHEIQVFFLKNRSYNQSFTNELPGTNLSPAVYSFFCLQVRASSYIQINQPTRCSSAVGRGRAGRPARPRPTALLPPRSNGKPEAATAAVELLIMGMRMPETCWAVFKRQAINLRNYCIWLVDSFDCCRFILNNYCCDMFRPQFLAIFRELVILCGLCVNWLGGSCNKITIINT